ncbi:hypothetical protein TNCV_3326861 [Trichonephila clavipes]|nr:hypothetical protein TNCV_3326861 [Trichonephila clavipes]
MLDAPRSGKPIEADKKAIKELIDAKGRIKTRVITESIAEIKITNIKRCRCCLVVKVTNSWLVCHEYKPGATEGLLCRGSRSALKLARLNRSPLGVHSLERRCQLKCRSRHFTMAQNYEVRLQ